MVGSHGIDVSTAAGGDSLDTELTPANVAYYVEIIEGTNAGHRFDVASVDGSTVVLATDTDIYQGPPYNTYVTSVGVPATLVGDRFILRRHHSLDDYFPPDTNTFTPQAHTFVPGHPADRVYLYESDWVPYWIYDNSSGTAPFWDEDGDAVFLDAGSMAIPPGGGIFLAPQETTVTLVGLGIVRKNPFAMPLPQGWSLQASPFPMDQSPAERFMNHETFDGGDDPATSDTVCFWLGNQDTYLPEFRCAFLYDPMSTETPRWLYADDEFLTARDFETEIFPRDQSCFYYRYSAPKPRYVIPLPWCVGLIGE
ncbi:MAG: hypothetical protein ABF370_20705 [Verrucomicrobiales bacterium]